MDAPARVTQEEGHTGFLHLPSAVLTLVLSREGFSRPFPSSTVKSNFVYPRTNRPPLVSHEIPSHTHTPKPGFGGKDLREVGFYVLQYRPASKKRVSKKIRLKLLKN